MNQSNHTTPEEDFIDLVQKEKALWDPSHHHYKDVETKTKIWRTLAELCNSTEMDVKRRWTGLREKYRREKIYNSKLRRSGAPVDPQRWPSFEKMAFLDRVYIPRGSYRVYRELDEAPNAGNSSDYFPIIKSVKVEENSGDEYNIGDYLETNVESPDDDGGMDMFASSLPSTHDQASNENHPFYGRLSKKQIQTLQSQQVWINSTGKSSMSFRDSSSPSLSQRSEMNNKAGVYSDNRPDTSLNRYQSFGVYIADTLNSMDDKHANELHISILQEIIKIQTKIGRENGS